MVFGTMADLRASLTQRKTVDPDHPLLVAARDRLEDEPADRRAQFDVIAARISAKFLGNLYDDVLPAESEEGLWGLSGDPNSPGFRKVYCAWQHAAKSSDLTATQLFEALTDTASGSAALTALLTKGVKMICTEDDDPSLIEAAVQRHLANVQGLFIQSDVDMLPLGPRAED
ncbi:hypothetical protein MNEG_6540 [Monoraphidium neglectum]|uniref:Uncharacterized protein n=1 Tax=Monoraphidium neglectum TaxID=145388 RepID=A0A0D2N641_9CHLO|nr:hypothetical protein MNEG_6540 [Monoraphidium neglectum]KIZ01421.1 hypothetical protein MNEG_6540 [Monoraphidium neglectum]|eukprot:XP_013900440.1 hypothetical protein MNEG_6540 [Monoraphidium neglectum]